MAILHVRIHVLLYVTYFVGTAAAEALDPRAGPGSEGGT